MSRIRSAGAYAAGAAAALFMSCLPARGQIVPIDQISNRASRLLSVEYRGVQPGGFPPTLELLHGRAGVIQAEGRSWLEATSKSTFSLPLGGTLAERFTLDVEVTLPPGGMVVYFTERWGVSDRWLFNGTWEQPFVVLSATEVGIRERPHAGGAVAVPAEILGKTDINGELVRLRIDADPSGLRVHLNDLLVATAPVKVPRSDRIWFETTGEPDGASRRSPELIPTRFGAISVRSGGDPTTSTVAATPGVPPRTGVVTRGTVEQMNDGAAIAPVGTTASPPPGGAVARPTPDIRDTSLAVVSEPWLDEARRLRAAGSPIGATAAEIGTKYDISENTLTVTLVNAGYTEYELVQWFRDESRVLPEMAMKLIINILWEDPKRKEEILAAMWVVYGPIHDDFAGILYNVGVDMEQLVRGMAGRGASTAQQAASLFKQAAIPKQTAAYALFKVNSLTAVQLATLMHQQGVPAGEVLTALCDFYGMSVATAMTTAGTRYPALQLLSGAVPLGITAEAGAAALRAGGHTVPTVLDAMARVPGLATQNARVAAAVTSATAGNAVTAAQRSAVTSVVAASEALRSEAETLNAMFAAIITVVVVLVATIVTVVMSLGYSASQIVTALVIGGQLTAGNAATAARTAGLPAVEVATTLVSVAKPAAMGSAQFLSTTLREGGYTAAQVSTVLRDGFQQNAQQTAVALSQGGFTIVQIRDALMDAFQLTAASALQLMASLGIS